MARRRGAMWLADDVEPDSEEGRARMMLALDEAENGRASPATWMPAAPVEPPGCSAPRGLGYSFNDGPPQLRSSLPWGALLLREALPADASHSALRDTREGWEAFLARGELTVWVEWGGLTPASVQGQFRLCVRHRGAKVAFVSSVAGAALSLTVTMRGLAPGEVLVACLAWEGGSRHLHCLTPLCAPLPLSGLLAPPPPAPESMRLCESGADAGVVTAALVTAADLPAPSLAVTLPTAETGRSAAPNRTDAPPVREEQPSTPPVASTTVPASAVSPQPDPSLPILPIPAPPLRILPDRGLGVELELLTPPPAPAEDGAWVSKMEQLRPVFAQAARREVDGAAMPVQAGSTEAEVPRDTGEPTGLPVECHPPSHLKAASLLAFRCGLWKQEPDDHIGNTSRHMARRILQQTPPWTGEGLITPSDAYSYPPVGTTGDGLVCPPDAYLWPPVGPARAACLSLLTGGSSAMKTEFKSPPPRDAIVAAAVPSAEASIPGGQASILGGHASISSVSAASPHLAPTGMTGPACPLEMGSGAALDSAGPKTGSQEKESDAGGALNLARNGAAEIASVVRAIRATGAGAPPFSEATGHCASAFHVHVNVRHATAGGDPLSDREVLVVWAAWVRFDLVTAR